MTRFTDYLLEHTEGFRVIVDRRADARSGPTPERVKVEPSGTNGTPAHDLSRLAAQSPTPTAYFTRGGTVFVLAADGSGVIVYEASKGAPSALQRRAIAVLEIALLSHAGSSPHRSQRRPIPSRPSLRRSTSTQSLYRTNPTPTSDDVSVRLLGTSRAFAPSMGTEPPANEFGLR